MYDKDGKETAKLEDAETVKTTYLSDKLITAYDGGDKLDSEDIKNLKKQH